MLKKPLVFTALLGLIGSIIPFAPATAEATSGICYIKHKHTGTGRGPSKTTAKWAARQKWKAVVLAHGHPRNVMWQYSKEQSASCSRSYGVYKCKVQAFPCEPGADNSTRISRGVNLDPWCKKKFGRYYKAKLIGKTAGSWVCLDPDTGIRKGISVGGACGLQHGERNVVKAEAKNWNDPYSWKCVLRGQY